MAFHVELAQNIEKIEKCTGYRYPYTLVDTTGIREKIDIVMVQNSERNKTVFILPEQELTNEELMLINAFIKEKSNQETILYTTIKEPIFDTDIKIKALLP